jgi:hypothetical protein
MRSRLRNRTRYRGGEPIRLTEGGIAPVLPGPGRGRSLKGAEDNLHRIARAFAAVAAYEGIASACLAAWPIAAFAGGVAAWLSSA